MALMIDQVLHGKRRRLRTNPEKILMDANGLRLWADYLDVAPGFSGRIDFIHKINIPALFRVECSGISDYEPADISWKPSHVSLSFEKDGIIWKEQKFITEEDAAVSCMTWENGSEEPFQLRLALGTGDGTFPTTFGEKLAVRFFCNGKETGNREWKVMPGETLELCVAAQVCLQGEADRMDRCCRLISEKYGSVQEAVRNQVQEYQTWFDQVPEFISDQPLIDRTWAYRWYILRHNRMRPGIGKLKETYFCEGRSHKMTKEPYHPEGWEFTKLIPLSVPMHLLDLRWYGQKEYGTSILHVMRDNQDESGEFRCAKVNWNGNPYANFFGWSVWQYYLVSGSLSYAREALPVVRKQIAAWQKNYGNTEDVLLTQYIHQLTGMEYQPSYWYFHGYPENCRDEHTFTPVKRVDRNVYHYLNVTAAEKLCRVCKDPEADQYHLLAGRIKDAILNLMWDEETGYFYDLHYQTNEKAFVKNIVGVFPFFGEMTDDRHRKCLEVLLTDEFNTPCPFPSVSTRCPVFTGEGGWKGQFFKGRNGCIWNGPAWPFANSMVLDGIGKESLKTSHSLDDMFRTYFRKFTAMHYYGGDGELPYLVEHYNSLTGECISDDVDYSHSYYIDLVVRYVAGITVEEDAVLVEPLDLGLNYFELKGIWIRGHQIDVKLDRDGSLSVTVDSEIAARWQGPGRPKLRLDV